MCVCARARARARACACVCARVCVCVLCVCLFGPPAAHVRMRKEVGLHDRECGYGHTLHVSTHLVRGLRLRATQVGSVPYHVNYSSHHFTPREMQSAHPAPDVSVVGESNSVSVAARDSGSALVLHTRDNARLQLDFCTKVTRPRFRLTPCVRTQTVHALPSSPPSSLAQYASFSVSRCRTPPPNDMV